jgi:hypothetical protein
MDPVRREATNLETVTGLRPTFGIRPRQGTACFGTDPIVSLGVGIAIALVAAQTVAQVVNFGFALGLQPVDSDKHASIFGAVSLLATAAAALAAGLRAVTRGPRRAWQLTAILITLTLALRISDVVTREALFALVLPLVACLFILLWRLTARDAEAPRSATRAGLLLLVFSYAVHAFGPRLVTAAGYGAGGWAGEVVGILKHGGELGGWALISTGLAASIWTIAERIDPREAGLGDRNTMTRPPLGPGSRSRGISQPAKKARSRP